MTATPANNANILQNRTDDLMVCELGPGGIDWNKCPGLWRNPRRMSGAWCFDQSRIPVACLLMNLESGMTLGEFLELFPMDGDHNVPRVLGYIATRLASRTFETSPDDPADERGVDWRECDELEPASQNGAPQWKFRAGRTAAAELFSHLAGGGSTTSFQRAHRDIAANGAVKILQFVTGRLDPGACDDGGSATEITICTSS